MRTYRTWAVVSIGLATVVAACDDRAKGGDDGSGDGVGTLRAKLAAASAHDVTAVSYRVVDGAQTCADAAIREANVTLEAESLPPGVRPPGSGPDHRFADALFTLPQGSYRVCATPLASAGVPSAVCAPAETIAVLQDGLTTEVALVSQCDDGGTGGFDVITVLNDPPQIDDLQVAPGKFITACEGATLTVAASDANGDSFSAVWDVVGSPAPLVSDGTTATFGPAPAGDYSVRVTLIDVHGGVESLTVPLHVSDADCGCEPFGVDAFGYVGCRRTEAVPSCDDIRLTGTPLVACDDCATTLELPFPFDFYGVPRASVDVISNGKLGFPGSSSFSNQCVLEPDTIAPFWDDLFPPAGGSVLVQTLGSAPARRFVVQWNVPHINGGDLYDVRAVLFEGSSDIRFCYANTLVGQPAVDSGASASVGISDATTGLQFSCESPQLTNGLSLEFQHP